jgi:uncharacterized protein with beta-barrel porin domain
MVAFLACLPRTATADDISPGGTVTSTTNPDTNDYRFVGPSTGDDGRLQVYSPGHFSTDIGVLTGNITLDRNGMIQFIGAEGESDRTAILANGASDSVLNLGSNTLTIWNSRVYSGTNNVLLNLNIGSASGCGIFAAGSQGTISVTGDVDPTTQRPLRTILSLDGGNSNNGCNITFDMNGGGLRIGNYNSVPTTTTFIARDASLILPESGTLTNFTYNVNNNGGLYVNSGGAVLLGDDHNEIDATTHLQTIVRDPATVHFDGTITYTGTNYNDGHRDWGFATMLVGDGYFYFTDGALNNTQSIAIGGGKDFLTGQYDSSVNVTLVVDSTNIAHLPTNLGFCGGKIDVSSFGEEVDLRRFLLGAITIPDGCGDPYPGGGAIVVSGTSSVVVRLSAANLLTRDGILRIERSGSSSEAVTTVVIDCNGGPVDPKQFAGLQLPANTIVQFENVGSGTVATGNIEGAGTVNADGNNLKIGSNVNTTQAFTGNLENVNQLNKTGSGTTNIGSGATVNPQSAVVSEGNLAVQQGATFKVDDGSGTLSVDSGGTLSGNGTIQGNVVVESGGWLCPGNSINSHTTAGDLTIQANGGIQIQTKALPTGQSVGNAGSDNDVERVTGTLALQNSSRILVTQDSTSTGSYKSGDRYYALVGQNGIQNLAGASVSDSISGVTVDRYGTELTTRNILGTDVSGTWFWFTVLRGFHADTANGRSVSDNLVALNDIGRMTALFDAIDSLSYDQQAAALSSLSGEPLATSQSLMIDAIMIQNQILLNRIRPGALAGSSQWASDGSPQITYTSLADRKCGNGNLDVWTFGYGVGGRIQADNNTAATSASSGGAMLGIERSFGDAGCYGLYYNYDRVYGGQAAYDAVTNVTDHSFGAYLTRRGDVVYALTTFGLGTDQYDSRRLVSYGSTREWPRTSYSGWQSQVYGETGVNWESRWCMVQPYVGLQYIYLRQNGVQEDGNIAALSALNADPADYNAFRTHLGARLSRDISVKRFDGSIEFRSVWIHEMLQNTAPLINASFAGAQNGPTFPIIGADLGRDWCWLGSGLQWRVRGNMNLYANYDVLVNIRETLHTGSGGVSFLW